VPASAKEITALSVEDFKRLLAALPEPLNIMVLYWEFTDYAYRNCLPQWEDIDGLRRRFRLSGSLPVES